MARQSLRRNAQAEVRRAATTPLHAPLPDDVPPSGTQTSAQTIGHQATRQARHDAFAKIFGGKRHRVVQILDFLRGLARGAAYWWAATL